ncbi:hypothetical protein OXYTRIMIC_765 [Oxytricha trifallax]|uniref:Uncharacterized protein n=1 Tax=Oxytricha trifallax TaxID=1172189 RepID=A0A073I012_9SPIT|nr:hypothetical protein OXYTRIMIC_765 [Oxytricha trifallax]
MESQMNNLRLEAEEEKKQAAEEEKQAAVADKFKSPTTSFWVAVQKYIRIAEIVRGIQLGFSGPSLFQHQRFWRVRYHWDEQSKKHKKAQVTGEDSATIKPCYIVVRNIPIVFQEKLAYAKLVKKASLKYADEWTYSAPKLQQKDKRIHSLIGLFKSKENEHQDVWFFLRFQQEECPDAVFFIENQLLSQIVPFDDEEVIQKFLKKHLSSNDINKPVTLSSTKLIYYVLEYNRNQPLYGQV